MSSPGTSIDPRVAWARLGSKGQVATVAALLGAAALFMVLPAFVRAILVDSAESQGNAESDVNAAKKLAEGFDGYLAQIDGRSLFLVPGPMVAAVSVPDEAPVDDGPKVAPKPSSYGGPAVVAGGLGTVWFDGGKRLKIGDSDGDLRVVSLDLPWDVTLEWQKVEFKVGLLTRDSLVIKSEKEKTMPAAAKSDAGEEETPGDQEPDSAKPIDAEPADPKPVEAKGEEKESSDPSSPRGAPSKLPLNPAPPPLTPGSSQK